MPSSGYFASGNVNVLMAVKSTGCFMSKLKRPVNVLIFEIILTAQILINNPVLVGIDLKPKKVFMIFGYE